MKRRWEKKRKKMEDVQDSSMEEEEEKEHKESAEEKEEEEQTEPIFIPIPGVKLIDQANQKGNSTNFKRPTKYIKFIDKQNNLVVYEMDDTDYDVLENLNKELRRLKKKDGK